MSRTRNAVETKPVKISTTTVGRRNARLPWPRPGVSEKAPSEVAEELLRAKLREGRIGRLAGQGDSSSRGAGATRSEDCVENSPIEILERIRRCKHCRREMHVSPLAYEENPYCTQCFDERVRGGGTPRQIVPGRLNGHYGRVLHDRLLEDPREGWPFGFVRSDVRSPAPPILSFARPGLRPSVYRRTSHWPAVRNQLHDKGRLGATIGPPSPLHRGFRNEHCQSSPGANVAKCIGKLRCAFESDPLGPRSEPWRITRRIRSGTWARKRLRSGRKRPSLNLRLELSRYLLSAGRSHSASPFTAR